ncbi:MAG: hypothetical protein AAGU27_23635 [Dehalobacterium sp.]
MGFQLVFLIAFRYKYKLKKDAFWWFIGYIIFFGFAGYKLLGAINTFEHNVPMGSENASLSISASGFLWVISIVCLLIGISRIASNRV